MMLKVKGYTGACESKSIRVKKATTRGKAARRQLEEAEEADKI
jgi:hypothetical protein